MGWRLFLSGTLSSIGQGEGGNKLTLDRDTLVIKLATRDRFRTESDIQSDIQTLLLHGGLSLTDPQVFLESQLQDGTARRIDVESGATLFEVKRSLLNPDAVKGYEKQLEGYVNTRIEQTGVGYVGILTDGTEWRLYGQPNGVFTEVTRHIVVPKETDAAERLTTWLEAVMATRTMINPTPKAIRDGLGNQSPSFALDIAEITAIYESLADHPEVQLKRSLWAKLLTTALGTQFTNDTKLFIEHTYLVLIAEIVAHAVLGYDLNDGKITPTQLVTGSLFNKTANIAGVVEQDFFDWVLHSPNGGKFVSRLAHRVARFNWHEPAHDVLKTLYESVIDAETRHSLGEYYTPDWMAERVITEVFNDPLNQRVLDPSCGSGTFIFHAVKKYLKEADENGIDPNDAVVNVTRMVSGIDLHPVAVTLARVTYLLAIGGQRLQDINRAPTITIPIYLGDSLQWEQTSNTMTFGDLVIPTGEGSNLFSRELRFPTRVTEDASTFDRLVERLSDLSIERKAGSTPPSLAAIFTQYVVHPDDQPEVTETFVNLCQLVDEGRNHIWSYFVRNTARPIWLSQPANNADVLVGNPPWLSYRFMPKEMQKRFKKEASERGLWAGGKVATHQDLSAFFVARATELYLKPGGKFAFVMPHAVLSRIQYAGFRSGVFGKKAILKDRSPSMEGVTRTIQFGKPWDFIDIRPHPFPVPSCVIYGVAGGLRQEMPTETVKWSGTLPQTPIRWDAAEKLLTPCVGSIRVVDQDEFTSPYKEKFTQGATLVPRMLAMVTLESSGPLGVGAGRVAVKSARSGLEKQPWKDLPSMAGIVEREFVYDVYLGSSIAPFRTLTPAKAVLPLYKGVFLGSNEDDDSLHPYPGLAKWWQEANAVWMAHRTDSSNLTLSERMNWQRTLEVQYPAAPIRVVYTTSGSILASAIVTEEKAIIDTKLYWANCSSLDEARYLTGVFNSAPLLEQISGLQSQGQFGARDFHTYVFHANYGIFDPQNVLHTRLVQLVERAELVAASAVVDESKSFQTTRKSVRDALATDGVAADIDGVVKKILSP